MDYTLADLVRITGAKRRSVQLWAEAGAIKADPGSERGGSGTHRRFVDWEAIIACVLNEFAKQSVAIGRLIEIGDGVRAFLASPAALLSFQNAIQDDGKHFLLVNTADFDGNMMLISEQKSPELTLYAAMKRFEQSGANAATTVILLNKVLHGLR